MTYPFLDRALVSFMLAIPSEQKVRPGQNKSLVRRSLVDVLPAPLLAKKHKIGSPTQVFLNAIRQSWPQLIDKLRAAEIFERGYADRETFIAHLSRARHGVITSSLLSVWRLFALEEWLQQRRKVIKASEPRRSFRYSSEL